MNAIKTEPILLQRDCEVTQIPSGQVSQLKKGTSVTITQSLGGSYTIVPTTGGMYRIANQDADALGFQKDSNEASPNPSDAGPVDELAIWSQLKTCFDPEIPVNIVDLGLIYDMKVSSLLNAGQRVDVKMTLTAPGCGMGPSIAADARQKILSIPGIVEADVQLVWDPPWNQSMISVEGRNRLGMA
jgi:probable FeS assembly SUF system protein SufT